MKKTVCIFCNQVKEKAKEHIWPKWLQIRIYGSTSRSFAGTHAKFGFKPVSQRISSGENLVLGAVCRDCNNGWMEHLESKFTPLLEKLLSLSPVIKINRMEGEIISNWAFKTCCVINRGSNYTQIIPDDQLRYFYVNQSIPLNVVIEMGNAKSATSPTLAWRQSKLQSLLIPSNYIMKFTAVIQDSYIITLCINGLLIRVVYWPLSINDLFIFEEERSKIGRLHPYNGIVDYTTLKYSNDIDEFSMGVQIVIK